MKTLQEAKLLRKKIKLFLVLVFLFICLLAVYINKPAESVEGTPSNVQCYGSYKEFPEDMVYANKESVERMKEYYKKVNFGGAFKKGNAEVYDLYKKKFAELLVYKHIVYDKDGEEFPFDSYFSLENFQNTKIYFFDFDEDDTPEFCTANIRGTCIIKYVPDVDQYHVLWTKMYPGGDILGAGRIGYSFDGSDSFFYRLDKEGNEQYIISYVMSFKEETIYMVSLPSYEDNSTDLALLKSMNQAYYSKSNGAYYIRVTEEQMDDLHTVYSEAKILAVQERVDLSNFVEID